MVPAKNDLASGHCPDHLQVRQCIFKVHSPADIPGNQHDVLLMDTLLPVSSNLLPVILPLWAEDRHGFIIAARQMQIPYGKNAHCSN